MSDIPEELRERARKLRDGLAAKIADKYGDMFDDWVKNAPNERIAGAYSERERASSEIASAIRNMRAS